MFTNADAQLLFSDSFDSGSVSDPASRATGSLAAEVKYSFTNNSAGEVAIVDGKLDWTGENANNGNLAVNNGNQNWTFVDATGAAYDWSSPLAGETYELRFTWHTAWSHPLAFGFSDIPQGGSWSPFTNPNYDFSFGSFGNDWRTGSDGDQVEISTNAGNGEFEILIRFDEPAGVAAVYVDDNLLISRPLDFENPGRYFSFGEPTQFGGYIDNFSVTVLGSIQATSSGDWSDPSIWTGNVVPGLNPSTYELDIEIPSGVSVNLDTSVEVGTVVVNGSLTASASQVSLVADSVVIAGPNASFDLGTPSSRYQGDFTLTLKGEPHEIYRPAGTEHNLGSRALLAIMGATLNLHGEDRLEWTKLAANAQAGDTSIKVAGAVDWRAGDEILIAPSTRAIHEFDRLTVAATVFDSVSDETTVTFMNNQSLQFFHIGEIQSQTRPAGLRPERTWTVDLRAEVALMTRNIIIQSTDDTHNDAGWGGHVMIHGPMNHHGMTMPGAEAYLQGIQLKSMGQKSTTGRYPIHWHMGLDSSKNGTIQQYLRDSVIDFSHNRAITIHGTDYLIIDNNVAYDYIGHGVFLEDGSERFNTITRNVMLKGIRPSQGEELLQSEIIGSPQNRGPAAYWITNPNNAIEDNVAAGTVGTAYWYAMPEDPLGLSGNESYYNGLEPYKEPLLSFRRNTAHSLGSGFDIFDRIRDSEGKNDLRLNLGWDNPEPHIFEDFTAYANITGIYCGLSVGGPSENNIFDNAKLVDNQDSLFLAANIGLQNSLFQADSGYRLSSLNVFYFSYDGPGRILDSHLVGFDASHAALTRSAGGATPFPNVLLSGITTDHEAPIALRREAFDLYGDPKRFTNIFYDADGSFTKTGSPKSIVPDHPFLLTGDEIRPPLSQNLVCNTHRYANFMILVPRQPIQRASMVRTKLGTPDAYSFGPPQNHHHQFPVIVNEDFLYTLRLETLPPSGELLVRNQTHNLGSYGFTVRYKGLGLLQGLSISKGSLPNTPILVNSIAEVDASSITAYHITSDGDLYIRHTEDGDFFIRWTNAPTNWPLLDADNDTLSDMAEIAQGSSPLVSNLASVEQMHFDELSDEFVIQMRESLFLLDGFSLVMSSDLITWVPVEEPMMVVDPNIDGNGQSRLLEVRVPMGESDLFFALARPD